MVKQETETRVAIKDVGIQVFFCNVIQQAWIASVNQSGRIFLFFLTKFSNPESNTYVFAQSSFDLIDLPYPCTNLNAVCQVYHCLLALLFASVRLSPKSG